MQFPLRRFILLAELVAGQQEFGGLVGGRTLYTDASPLLRVEHASWDEFLQGRGSNFRQQVRRFPRKLAELGTVSYRLTSDPLTLDRDLDTLFDLHRRRWDGANTPFLLAAGLHRDIAASALRRGWLRLWFLQINRKPVAAYYGFRVSGVEMAYQGGGTPHSRSIRSASFSCPTPCAKPSPTAFGSTISSEAVRCTKHVSQTRIWG